MLRITLWLLSTVTAVVLLFSYRTSTMGAGAGITAADGSGSTGGDTISGGLTSGGTAYKGAVITTRWGDVQVIIVVAGRRITGVAVPVYPDAYVRDRVINEQALPVLISSTLDAQSADIDAVTGATATSEGYIGSLQSAIDAAGLS